MDEEIEVATLYAKPPAAATDRATAGTERAASAIERPDVDKSGAANGLPDFRQALANVY